ncbi:MAG TPA: DUF1349 domain-containing protein [Puia sp.]|nr:DUF1349 domain-containing protein [Puia sp.]
MFTITDAHIDLVLEDLSSKGVSTEDLRQNLLDHICILAENHLVEADDFETWYRSTIPSFYRRHLGELEEETQFLLKHRRCFAVLNRWQLFLVLFVLLIGPVIWWTVATFGMNLVSDTRIVEAWQAGFVFGLFPLLFLLVLFLTPDRFDPLIPRGAKILLGWKPFISVVPRLASLLLMLAIPFAGLYAQQGEVRLASLPRPLFWENSPLAFTAAGGSFTIEAGPKTDMFRDPNVTYNTDNAPKLLFVADSNFVLTAAIHHDFVSKWDGGAIVLKADSLNWIKFCFEKDYTGQRRVVSVVTKDISDDCNSAAVAGNTVHYKIAKAGNVITLYFSKGGRHWFLIRHLTFDGIGPLKLGFLAQSPTGGHCTVTFSDIHYSTRKIADPYTGE